ncbi:MAG: peptidoglycan-binding protein, partial [Gaiellaceae bacterium]
VEVCLAAERTAKLPEGLLLAIASRETHCRNIAGDGGHGRGVFQIDDRFHGDWLRRHGAGAPGAVPSVADGAAYAAELLNANFAYGRGKGLKGDALLKFAAAAYNAGAGGAWAGVQVAGDPDARTANRNYGADVLERMSLVRGWIEPSEPSEPSAPDARPLVTRGSSGPAVVELKRKLRAWYAANPTIEMPGFRLNPAYGAGVERAVTLFQRLNGLEVDGVVGPQTWNALDAADQLH